MNYVMDVIMLWCDAQKWIPPAYLQISLVFAVKFNSLLISASSIFDFVIRLYQLLYNGRVFMGAHIDSI